MLLDKLKNHNIYLVSKSPRRRELLGGMGVVFEILDSNVEETYDPLWAPKDVVMHLSKLKLSVLDFNNFPKNSIFIACDTIVVIDDIIIGKPHSREEAVDMLHRLSDNTHTVYSGMTVCTPQKSITDFRATDVVFEKLSDEMIDYYVNTYQPFDKAGAYGVQEWIGYVGIRGVNGSFYNVMGLPTRLLWQMLDEIIK